MKGRAAQIVACLSAAGPLEVSDIARRCNIPRSSVNRVCLDLVETGEVERQQTRPVSYAVAPGISAPSWTTAAHETAPMCKALYEAARANLKTSENPNTITEHPQFQAASKLWGKRGDRR